MTDTAGMFNGASAFNNGGSDSIANWNTSNLVIANDMFRKAASFNQPIGSWDMKKVQFLVRFFKRCNFVQSVIGVLAIRFVGYSARKAVVWCGGRA